MHRVWRTFITIQWVTVTKHFNHERFRRWNQINKKKKWTLIKISQGFKIKEKVHNKHHRARTWSSTERKKLVQK